VPPVKEVLKCKEKNWVEIINWVVGHQIDKVAVKLKNVKESVAVGSKQFMEQVPIDKIWEASLSI